MRAKILRKEKMGNREVLVFKNTAKPRLPMAKGGFAFKTSKKINVVFNIAHTFKNIEFCLTFLK